MKLSTYIKRFSLAERAAFALRVGTTLGHFNNVVYGMRVPSAALARQIAAETEGAVPVWELRSHDWHLIWPEFIGLPGAPGLPAATDQAWPLHAQAAPASEQCGGAG